VGCRVQGVGCRHRRQRLVRQAGRGREARHCQSTGYGSAHRLWFSRLEEKVQEVEIESSAALPVRSDSRLEKVDVRLPGKGISNSHGARPVHLIITMFKWIRTSMLSRKNSLLEEKV